MEIKILNRKHNKNEISIERLFSFIFREFEEEVDICTIENPYSHGFLNILKSIVFFRKAVNNNDIVHITGDIHYAAIGLKSKNIIITVHDLGMYRDLSRLRYLAFKTLWITIPFKKAKYIVAISEKTKKEVLDLLPYLDNKVLVIPNCITLDIENETKLKNNVRLEVLIIGTRENKNIKNSIKALKGLDVNINIIGKLDKDQVQLLTKLKINYRNFVNIDELALLQMYRKVDVLLFPSLYEGFGLPILEAQAQNVLVITSNISPMKDVCGEGGVLVDPYSIESIRKAVIGVMQLSKNQKMDYILKGKINLNKYGARNIANQYFELYKKIGL